MEFARPGRLAIDMTFGALLFGILSFLINQHRDVNLARFTVIVTLYAAPVGWLYVANMATSPTVGNKNALIKRFLLVWAFGICVSVSCLLWFVAIGYSGQTYGLLVPAVFMVAAVASLFLILL